MDNLRFVLFILFAFLVYSLYEAWQIDYGPKNPAAIAAAAGTAAPNVPGSAPSGGEAGAVSGQRIRVATDLLTLELDTTGGDVRLVDLLAYAQEKDHPEKPVRLMSDEPSLRFIAQSGFLAEGAAPNHQAQWKAAANAYRLADGQDTLRVPLTWTDKSGLSVTKTYVFKRGSYTVAVEHEVQNQSDKSWHARQYAQLQRKRPDKGSESQLVRTYTGGVYYNAEDKYKKVTFDDMADDNLNRTVKDGWLAMIQHYFLAAWIPPAGENNTYYTKDLGEQRYLIGAYTADHEVLPGERYNTQFTLYVGPKIQKDLEAIAPGLELTVDFGVLTFIAKPIFWLLDKFHGIYNNWGWSIISVTFVIKLMFFKLSEASYRSMANMRKLQPRLKILKDRYGEDKQRYNQAMMELYREEKVNPLGGCLPILIQIPVFISLYWVLAESVELRQAPFLLWLTDLSAKDPYFLLPVLMGISMYIQQKLNPSTMDPVQERVMKMFPFIFTIFFAFFPSGLVLYWVVNNSLSIVQQWYITRQIEKTA
ncbi:membrane protein insertase YidC [Methylogaea oryzae]|uniref:Membrane protein insertase YidC n=2 Tax=Methylogaea oryzae TaxID=1295382 RepID=A0A8D5AM80_9GAMM|nr:membrane protein insertase YidC [Methylogaea oryzae]BBL72901.1 membrane protein insertase YidC [Methylogaea oryzae]